MSINFRFLWVMMAGLAATPAAAQTPAPAQPPPPAAQPGPAPASTPPSGPIYAVTYFEVAPGASRAAGNQLRQFAAAARKEAGNLEFLPLRDATRPGRFAWLEAWKDKAALDAHGAATKALAEKWRASFAAPFDTRLFWPMAAADPSKSGGTAGAVLVLTHVDVFPAGKDQVAGLIKQLVEASRKDGGALRFDALIQDGRPNHFHLVEAWANAKARGAHALAEHTKEFRAKLVPFEGALYDERLYEAIR